MSGTFPHPQRRDGQPPCGECRLRTGETCDICGAIQSEPTYGGIPMRVNATNMLRQAAGAIDRRKDDGSYAYMLGELAEHLGQVRDGEHTWEEFAEAYCLTERDRKAVGQ